MRTAFTLVLVVAAAMLAGCREPTETPATRTVLLITVDTLRADRIGAYGHPNAGTPEMDRLAANGALFEAAQTTAPLTLPGHSSILTGCTLAVHGVYNNGTYALNEEIPTLAESFQAADFATGGFVSARVLASRYGLARGFDHYDDRIEAEKARQAATQFAERSAKTTIDRALGWLTQQDKDVSAFVWLHLWEPHTPYWPPPEFREQFPDDPYQGEVAAVDAAIANLLERVSTETGRSDPLVVITSDHGESLGEHGESTHGMYLYRSVMRVPLIVFGPGWGIAPQTSDTPVSVADIAPTLAELAGVAVPDRADGISLAAFLRGDAETIPREAVYAESWLPRIDFGWSGLRALVTHDHKFIQSPQPELFDRKDDIDEAVNLLADKTLASDEAVPYVAALEELVERAKQRRPATGSETTATEEEIAMLQSLGYAGSSAIDRDEVLVDPEARDTKDVIGVVDLRDAGIRSIYARKPAQAVDELQKALDQDPGNPSVAMWLSSALLMTGETDRAEDLLREIVDANPDFGEAWMRLARMLGKQDRTDEQEQALKMAAMVDPYNVIPLKGLAMLYLQQERYDEAIETMREAAQLDPHDPDPDRVIRRAEHLRQQL